MSGPGLFRLGVDVSRETSDQLEPLTRAPVLRRRAVKFVGRATIEDVCTKYVLDPAQLPLTPAEAKTRIGLVSCSGFRSPPHPEEPRGVRRLEGRGVVLALPILRGAPVGRSSR